MTTFIGSAEGDLFTGGNADDVASGNGGDDTLAGSSGGDTLAGNAGADTLDGGSGNDQIYGGDVSPDFNHPYYGNDWTAPLLDTGSEVDTLNGGGGDDRIFAGYGDNVDGGAHGYWGDDLYISFLGATAGVTADFGLQTQIIGGATITGIESVAWIEGSNFDDDINIGSSSPYSGFTSVWGMGGNDRLVAGYYTGTLFGGDGNDIVDGRGSQYLQSVDGGAGRDILYAGSGLGGIARGGSGNDTIYAGGEVHGDAGDDLIIMQWTYYEGSVSGDDGDDEIRAAGSGNSIAGGAGADILTGDSGADTLVASSFSAASSPMPDGGLERDRLSGGGGNDVLWIGYGDDADGGDGNDTVRLSLAGATSGVAFSTAGITGPAPFDFFGGVIAGVEKVTDVIGSDFGDTITVATHGFAVRVEAGTGNDTIKAGGSSVTALGGAGDDRFVNGVAGDTQDGGEGTDTVDYRDAAAGVTVTLGMAANDAGTGPGGDRLLRIENLSGSAFADTLLGSGEANYLRGEDGDDTLRGRGGNDKLAGGLGNDTYIVEDAGDIVVEAADGGTDTIQSSVSHVLGAHAENLVLTGGLSSDGTGNALANVITGNAGHNRLDGGLGADLITGGAGDDVYVVDEAGDAIVEAAFEGSDLVESSVSHILGADFEKLTLTGAAAIAGTGNRLANILVGNGAGNALSGGAGNDLLDGAAGVDRMAGGLGSDSFVVDHSADKVIEAAADAGLDVVSSSVSFVIRGGVEQLVLTGAAAISGTGNGLANKLTGNDGANRLDGGAGADTMAGGLGNDSYQVDDVGDRLVEADAGGFDTVRAAISYTLGAQVENLTLVGAAALDGTGNSIANVLAGNGADNRLDGAGGADTMAGGAGNDAYVVDDSGDRISERRGAGSDSVASSASFTLDNNVEALALTGRRAIDGTGNRHDNLITGNGAANALDGGAGNDTLSGGLGRDLLTGGTGLDLFAFASGDTAASRAGADAITDFSHAQGDRIDLSAFDADTATAEIDDAFSFIGGAAFSGTAGELRIEVAQGNTFVLGDASGDGIADFCVRIDGLPTLLADDFVL
ncbi:MAG TPA: hypothetical protein VGW34_07335 [Allosphingosinicella sp.]|nr:hypothetical protein [Allosphingosinicella sp.]